MIGQYVGPVDRYRVDFDLDEEFTTEINSWDVKFGLKNRVQILELEMVDNERTAVRRVKSLRVLHLKFVDVTKRL